MKRLKLLAAGLAFAGVIHAAEPGPASYELALVDMQGQKKVLGTLDASVYAPRMSPDGKHVAFELADEAGAEQKPVRLYVADLSDLAKRKALQPTVIAQRHSAPVWSPDGKWIAFAATGNGTASLFKTRSDGSIQPIYVADGAAPEGFYRGNKLGFITLQGNRDYDIAMLDLETGKSTPLVRIAGSAQHNAQISPDGNWLVYVSDETGRQEVWLEPLPQTGTRFQLTRQGGRHPVWSPDGKRIYFDTGARLYGMDVTLGAEARAAEPVALPITGFQQTDIRRQFDLTPDGKAFLMLFPVKGR